MNSLIGGANIHEAAADSRSASAHLELLPRHLPVTCWTTGERLRLTSHARLVFLGRNTPRRLLGSTISQYFRCSREDQSLIQQHLDALLGIPSKFGLQRHQRGFEMAVEPCRAANGAIVGCAGMAFEVTAQRVAAEEIRCQSLLQAARADSRLAVHRRREV